ncbi:hypothetical protein ILS93_27210 [Bacillus sp. 16GRE42]|nr:MULTISPECIES: hypothetical protein [Bacillus]MBY7125743.1 hypothetical protein [Bacillus sp. 16GRE42]PEV93984.1 hypothetical protein CN442_00815 [Bacillus thuringiensis]
MVRSFSIGMTDYSHQSLEDMQQDLIEWKEALIKTMFCVKEILDKLEKTDYWENFDFDFKLILYSSMKMFETAITEINEIIQGFNIEILEYHVRILTKIGSNGEEFYRNYGVFWNSDSVDKEYGTERFQLVERLYQAGRGMAGDLIDLLNLAGRLKDFIGRKGEGYSQMNKKHQIIFNAPIGAVQQNFEGSTGIQNIGDSNKEEINELKTIIREIQAVLNMLPEEEREEVQDNLSELNEIAKESNPKPIRVKAFANGIVSSLKKILTMKTIDNATQLTEKLPKIIEGFEKIIKSI